MEKEVKKINEFLKIIADKNRLKILVFLKDSPKCVCQIFPFLKISQKLASHHLSQLKKLGLVNQERDGNFNFYSLDERVIKKYIKDLNFLIK